MIKFGRGVCYSGYREGQSPITHVYPTYAQILEDLTILRPHFDYLRMYDVSEHAKTVLRVIEEEKLPFKVMLGVEPKGEISNPNCPWGGLHSDAEIAQNKIDNVRQLDRLAELANRYQDIVLAVAVGTDVRPPAPLHAVEGEQVRGGRRAALEFVEVDHFQPVARARVVRLPLCCTHRGAQRQAADAAHAVDANFHVTLQLIKLFRKFETLARICDTHVIDQAHPLIHRMSPLG